MPDIILNSENLKRFSKRLHKSLSEEQVNFTLSKTQQLLSKAIGCNNVHELEQRFIENKKNSINKANCTQENILDTTLNQISYQIPEMLYSGLVQRIVPRITSNAFRVRGLLFAVANILDYMQFTKRFNKNSSKFFSGLPELDSFLFSGIKQAIKSTQLTKFENANLPMALILPITQYFTHIGRGDKRKSKYFYLTLHDEVIESINTVISNILNSDSETGTFLYQIKNEDLLEDMFFWGLIEVLEFDDPDRFILKCYQINDDLFFQTKNPDDEINIIKINLSSFQNNKDQISEILKYRAGTIGINIFEFLNENIPESPEECAEFSYKILKRHTPPIIDDSDESERVLIYQCKLKSNDSEIIYNGHVLKKTYSLANIKHMFTNVIGEYISNSNKYFVLGDGTPYGRPGDYMLPLTVNNEEYSLEDALIRLKQNLTFCEPESECVEWDCVVGRYASAIGSNETMRFVFSDELWLFSSVPMKRMQSIVRGEPCKTYDLKSVNKISFGKVYSLFSQYEANALEGAL